MADENTDLASSVNRHGYAVARNIVPTEILERLKSLCLQAPEQSQARRNGKSLYGVRQLLDSLPELRSIVDRAPFLEIAKTVIGLSARAVKGIYFDKTPTANWLVPWHQDVTITVKERRDVPGFEARPVQEGVVHVLPPVSVSENLLTLRIHLDDAPADHGALRVLPQSHLTGRLEPSAIREWIDRARKCALRSMRATSC